MKNLIELLMLRTEFEELTTEYKFPEEVSGSCINTLNWFVQDGHKSNSLRNGFDDAKKIAQKILTEYTNVRTDKGRYQSFTEDC